MSKDQIPELAKGEEELVRRLGLALLYQWQALPPFAQDQLLEQACLVEAWPEGIEIRKSLNSFLQKTSGSNHLGND